LKRNFHVAKKVYLILLKNQQAKSKPHLFIHAKRRIAHQTLKIFFTKIRKLKVMVKKERIGVVRDKPQKTIVVNSNTLSTSEIQKTLVKNKRYMAHDELNNVKLEISSLEESSPSIRKKKMDTKRNFKNL
jgi:ribosomal protein S17